MEAVTARDGDGATTTAQVTVGVTPVNDMPVAGDDAYATAEDTALSVAVGAGVLGNDGDVEGPLAITAYDHGLARGGVVAMNGDGSFTYTPAAGVSGRDAFTYQVIDGDGARAAATVSIDIAPAVNGPVAHARAALG